MKRSFTETQIVAKAVNEFMTTRNRRKLKDIHVLFDTQLMTSEKFGWKVFFVFEEADSFLRNGMTFEVGIDGEVRIVQSL